jgi:uncharacterized RDD family membrane protein YckC
VYCPQCGVNNDRGETSCYICGAALPSIAAPSQPAGRGGRAKSAAVAAERQATVGDRALALIFDRLLIGAILMIIAAWYTSGSGGIDPSATSAALGGLGIFAGVMLVYHVILEAAVGTTLGKAMMSLVVRAGDRGRFVGVLLRNLLRLVDSVGFYLLGFLFAMFTARGQRVGDLVGDTVVMERPPNQKLRAGLMVLWAILIGASIWFAWALCPTCTVVMPRAQ